MIEALKEEQIVNKVGGRFKLSTLIQKRLVALNAGVRHPRLAVIVHDVAVVDRAQMLVRVARLNYAEEAIPIGQRFRLHEVPLIRERPPHVAIRCEPRNYIAKIPVVHFGWQVRVAPVIVGMEQDQIGLDVEVAQLREAVFESPEVLEVEAFEVP